jgi:hypothetical protein
MNLPLSFLFRSIVFWFCRSNAEHTISAFPVLSLDDFGETKVRSVKFPNPMYIGAYFFCFSPFVFLQGFMNMKGPLVSTQTIVGTFNSQPFGVGFGLNSTAPLAVFDTKYTAVWSVASNFMTVNQVRGSMAWHGIMPGTCKIFSE